MSAGDPILDVSDLINIATGGASGTAQQVNFFKTGLRLGIAPTAPVAGRISSLWFYDGMPGGASTAPTTATALTSTTAGGLQATAAASSQRFRFLGMVATGLVAGSVILYDRLVQHGGLSGTTTGAQTTNLPTAALTRQTTGVGVEAWLEVYTIVGSTGTTATISYTDQSGVSGNTSSAITFGGTGFREQDRILPVALASGDYGVRAVASVTLAGSTATAGAFGVTLAYPIIVLPIPIVGVGALHSSFLLPGGPIDLGVNGDPCLAFAWHPNTTTAPTLFGSAYFLTK